MSKLQNFSALRVLAALAIILAAAGGAAALWPRPVGPAQASVVGLAAQGSTAGFARADGPRELTFPRDHGPHPDFQTEWWYYTGNLQAADGRRFGFQLTFFRRAALSPGERQARASAWAVEQVYLAHFTVTDAAAGRFWAFERLERGAAGLAGAELNGGLRVWLHDWSVEQTGADRYRLRALQEGVAVDLELLDRKGPVLHGERGYSRKGPEAGNASYYYSQTRLETSGTVQVGGQSFSVTGLSWMDREFSTSALSQGQVGWNWFALQLDDGSEIMMYTIRRKDGSPDPFSSGTWIDPQGVPHPLKLEDYQITEESTWTSPHSGGKYPAGWRVSVPSLNLSLQVEPLLADQELNLSYSYWEGAVRVTGTRDGGPVAGYGYVELTGYARSMEGGL